jgi:hypothetical protein
MAKLTIIDNPDITLWYYEETKIIHHQIHKPSRGESFRQVLAEGLNLVRKTGAKKWLSDDRNNIVQTPEDVDWATTVWTPEMIKAGWKYWALILPEIMLGELNMKHFIKDFEQLDFVVKVFTNPGEAIKWLEEVE